MLSDREIEDLADALAKRLIRLGIDVEHPLEMQKDLAHLRKGRIATETAGPMVRKALIGGGVTAAGSALYFLWNVLAGALKGSGHG